MRDRRFGALESKLIAIANDKPTLVGNLAMEFRLKQAAHAQRVLTYWHGYPLRLDDDETDIGKLIDEGFTIIAEI